jgi:putative addiction module component (TIGR02574 family)
MTGGTPMSEAAEKLKPLLAALTATDRTELVEYLLNLENVQDELSDEEWEAQWADECNRRLGEFEAGKVKLIPAEEVMRTMKEKYG